MPRLVWFNALGHCARSPLVVGQAGRADQRCGEPCAVLADGQDASGVVMALEGGWPWRLQVELTADGNSPSA